MQPAAAREVAEARWVSKQAEEGGKVAACLQYRKQLWPPPKANGKPTHAAAAGRSADKYHP